MQEYAGVIALVSGIVLAILVVLAILLLLHLRSQIAVQKLTFLGFFSTDFDSRKHYAELTVGNKSLNDVGISAIGIKNGKISFDLTELYRNKLELTPDTRIVIEQRSALKFCLETDELTKLLIDGKNGKKILKTLRVYVVDVTGKLFQGRVPAVRKLLLSLMQNKLPPVQSEPVPAKHAPAQNEAPAPKSAKDDAQA